VAGGRRGKDDRKQNTLAPIGRSIYIDAAITLKVKLDKLSKLENKSLASLILGGFSIDKFPIWAYFGSKITRTTSPYGIGTQGRATEP